MRFCVLFVFFAVVLPFLTSAAMAIQGAPMIEVGGGLSTPGNREDIEVVLKVEYGGAVAIGDPRESNWYFVIAKFRAVASGTADQLSYVDVEFVPVAGGLVDAEMGAEGWLTLGTTSIQRNVALGNDAFVRFSAIGLRLALQRRVSEKVKIYSELAFDLAALGFAKINGSLTAGTAFGGRLEIGAVIAQKFRIVLGERLDYFTHVSDRRFIGRTCDERWLPSYCDEDGCQDYRRETVCQDNYVTVNGDDRLLSNTYLNLSLDLSRHLSVFGMFNYAIYSAAVTRDELTNTTTTQAFEAMFGLSGKW